MINASNNPVNLKALSDANDYARKIEPLSASFLHLMTKDEPQASNEEINQLSVTDKDLFAILENAQRPSKKMTIPPIRALQTQKMISQVVVVTAFAKAFLSEPDREKKDTFPSLISKCAQMSHSVGEKEEDQRSMFEVLDKQVQLLTIAQLKRALECKSQSVSHPALSSVVSEIGSKIISDSDLEQVRQYAELVDSNL